MFIVLDGPDGSGKSTLAKCLSDRLTKKGQRTVYTKEPTCDSEAGRTIRHILQGGVIDDIYGFSDLFVVDRHEHLNSFIQPHLASGDWVVCDRYKYSALAYQQAQGVDVEYLIESNKSCLVPDIILLLIPSSAQFLLRRITQRGNTPEIFEREEFLESIIRYYKKLPTYFPEENFHYLDATLSIENNLCQIEKFLGTVRNLGPRTD